MLAASQDIDSFIERQRSKLNKQPVNNRQPPPHQLPAPTSNVNDRLDYQVARIFDEPPPARRVQSQQPYHPPSPPHGNASMSDVNDNYYPSQQHRRLSDDNRDDNSATFFNKFGTYDDKRSQLKDDLKREYNEYLQSQKRVGKSKSTSQLSTPRNNTNKRVQFQQDNGKVVAPWEKNEKNTIKNVQSMNNVSSTSNEYSPMPRHSDDQYIRDREGYILELHSQIRELETRRKQLDNERNRLSGGVSSNVARAHYAEDINALDSLLEERIGQREAVDHDLAHILNRPPVSANQTRIMSNGISNLNISNDHSQQISTQKYQQPTGRPVQSYRQDNRQRQNDNEFSIGQEVDKDSEQAAKKRYQQELQAQIREAQMRKAQDKRKTDEYERKLEEDVKRYNYFGRSGGGAPMRDKDGNIVANLADVRNPPPSPPPQRPQQQQHQQQQQQYFPPNDQVYALGNGQSSISNAPFYNGEQQQYPSNTGRSGSPNHARGAVSNGIFGAAKTEEQFVREERYKNDLKKQIDEKRQRDAEEVSRRRAEEERELAKHVEWQQQMDKQVADEAFRKQQKEEQERLQQQQLQEQLEMQKKQEELASKRKPKRPEKPMTPKRDENENNDHNNNNNNNYHDETQQPSEPAFRSSSPPIPAIKNKGKKPKSTTNNVKRSSYDDVHQRQSPPSLPPYYTNDDSTQQQQPPPIDETESRQGQQTYRKPPTPRQPEVSSARKKPPQINRQRAPSYSNHEMPMRVNSTTSLRSDGSDSEVLNRLEHLKRQLKDKEARLQEHVDNHQSEQKITYQPPIPRKQSPGLLFNAARVHHRDTSATENPARHILDTDDDHEFKPSYFRDDAILMGGTGAHNRRNSNEKFSSIKRNSSTEEMFTTNTQIAAKQRQYYRERSDLFDDNDPTHMANYELNRIVEQNEKRLKKLRDLEHDDASLVDSNDVLERFQHKQRLQRGGSQTTLQDDTWLK